MRPLANALGALIATLSLCAVYPAGLDNMIFVLPPAWTIFVKAAVMARDSGASEIGVDELLAAFTSDLAPNESVEPKSDDAFIPIPRYEVPLSPAAAAAITSAGGLETVSVDQLRTALLGAKGKG
jgi:hypothetical protein